MDLTDSLDAGYRDFVYFNGRLGTCKMILLTMEEGYGRDSYIMS